MALRTAGDIAILVIVFSVGFYRHQNTEGTKSH